MPNEALLEEITSINAIYSPTTIEIISSPPASGSTLPADSQTTTVTLLLPETHLSFLLSFQSTYPELSPPHIDGTASVIADSHTKKGGGRAAVEVLAEIISRVWTPGQVCLFDLIEEARAHFQQQTEKENNGTLAGDKDYEDAVEEDQKFVAASHSSTEKPSSNAIIDPANTSTSLLPAGTPPPSWILSDPLTVNKSTFLAHCVGCVAKTQASAYLSHLLSTNKRVAAATHNISALRLKDPETGVVVQDSDDDGETAAGGRLLHLMQLMDVWNVMVVVTRWYGGVKLGPERFRCINGVARDVLVKAGYGSHGKEEKGSSKKGKK